jgi:mannose/fructose-specific phosphotransferase system component IIA
MTPPVPTLLVTHRGYGEGLLVAATAILGERPDIDHLTNEGLSPEALQDSIGRWLDAHGTPALVLTDLVFGSCGHASRLATRGRAGVGVMAGVNLPLLLALLRSREHQDLRALLLHLRQRAEESVQGFVGGDPLEGCSA